MAGLPVGAQDHVIGGHEGRDVLVPDRGDVVGETVKFIEVGRLTPGNFAETFDQVYKAVKKSVRSQ